MKVAPSFNGLEACSILILYVVSIKCLGTYCQHFKTYILVAEGHM
jgi:hypothetical protein